MERRLIDRWLFWDEYRLLAIRMLSSWTNNTDISYWGEISKLMIAKYSNIADFCAKRKEIVEQDMAKALCGK